MTKSPISIDPNTGLKVFNTRASKPPSKMAYVGYGVVDNADYKTLPEASREKLFDEAAQAHYFDYKSSREGAADYVRAEGDLARFVEDVHSGDPVPRDALDDECEIMVVGAGFSGLMLWHKLQSEGFTDVRICEKGGDVGGTWYWNRYPGIACDVEAYSYLPLLEEMDYIPSMKFASGYEIYSYCQKIAEKFKFYDRCLFHTVVEKTQWDEEKKRWRIETNRGDVMHARHLILANGILTTPKLARIEGMDTFKGHAFHTSAWNYNVDLAGKDVGVIGTGATAVQLVPELAKVAKSVTVFQRTPSTVDVRDQRETTPEEVEEWSKDPHWARDRRARFSKITTGRTALQGNDDYLSGKVSEIKKPKKHVAELTKEEIVQKQLQGNYRLMEQIRGRVDSVVKDPKTAEILKPYYTYGCKRPTFHDEYLPAFNLPQVKLVDVAPHGVSRINERGVVHGDTEYPLDIIAYATGFQWMASATFENIYDAKGQSLMDKWRTGGTRTFLGVHSHGFPNLFIMAGPQGGGGKFNFTETCDEHGDYIVWLLKTLRDRGVKTVDVTTDIENDYASHCRTADEASRPLRDCASYYNGEGHAEPGALAYYGGDEWYRYRDVAQATLSAFIFDGEQVPQDEILER
ncbi:NAD(P)/FAD-dependent oxidoreductase [Aurantivibrio plasticivorans]